MFRYELDSSGFYVFVTDEERDKGRSVVVDFPVHTPWDRRDPSSIPPRRKEGQS